MMALKAIMLKLYKMPISFSVLQREIYYEPESVRYENRAF
jgi:hypothetical protein